MDGEIHFENGMSGDDAAKHLIAHLPFSMVLADPNRPDCPIVYVNRAFEAVTGYSASYALGKNCRFLQGDDRDQTARERLREAISKREAVTVDIRNYRVGGEKFINRLMIAPVADDEGQTFAFVGVQTELSEEEAANTVTADQASRMLQETQHRVKNHLSMVASMIRLQKNEADDSDPGFTSYDVLARRVESLSLLYDEFTSAAVPVNDRYDVVSAGGYISRVASTIGSIDGRKSIRLNVDTDVIPMRTDTAARLGLLASEVLSNTLQHAFEGRSEGLVEVRLKASSADRIRLTVSDDGIGLGDTSWPEEGNLGAKIVRSLVQSLGGDLTLSSSDRGTIVSIDLNYELPTEMDGGGERTVVG